MKSTCDWSIEWQSEMEELQRVLNLPVLPQHVEGFDISNISGTLSVASSVCFQGGRPNKDHYRHYRIKTVEGSDDFASMAEVVGRRYARVKAEGGSMPDLVMVDGGKGQLMAALNALWKLEIRELRVIGLAKQMEEIHVADQTLPIRLPRTSPALHFRPDVADSPAAQLPCLAPDSAAARRGAPFCQQLSPEAAETARAGVGAR
jgi:excinuclease ABC subunit C